MTTRELSRLKGLRAVVVRENDKLAVLNARAKATTSNIGGSSRSGISDKTGISADIADQRDKVRQAIAEAEAEKIRLEECINRVDDPYMRTVLMYRYIDGYSWETIAAKVGGYNTAATLRVRAHRCVRNL